MFSLFCCAGSSVLPGEPVLAEKSGSVQFSMKRLDSIIVGGLQVRGVSMDSGVVST